MTTVSPYGSWKSPISSDLIVSGTVGLGQIVIDGEDIYWIEGRPSEAGRSVIVRRTPDGKINDVTPDIFNLLLQVMDHGTLTDNNGRKSDFRHVILVMTTNCGAQELSRVSMGFKEQDHSSDGAKAIEKKFSPEFRNRLDAVVQFKALSRDAVYLIVEKILAELQGRLKSNVLLNVDPNARNWLADHGYDKLMGARPMDRLVKDVLKKPLADELLFGELSVHGGRVSVTVDKNELKVSFESNES